MKNRKFPIVLAGVLAVTACAKSPESIAPSYVSNRVYDGYSCAALLDERANVSSALASASQQQSDARTNDVVGVILIGIPVSTLSGDNVAHQVAELKGHLRAIDQTVARKQCKGSAPSASAQEAAVAMSASEIVRSGTPVPKLYEGAPMSAISAPEMRGYCGAAWETRVNSEGRTEFNPCKRPDAFAS